MWRKVLILSLFVFIILILLPALLTGVLFQRGEQKREVLLLKLYDHQRGEIMNIELEEYLRGVVAAEMPALYHMEALKAQAVVARTYTLKQLPRYGGPGSRKYPGADLSTDYTECQAFLTEAGMKEKWGSLFYFYYWYRINKAVESTRGQVMLYDGKLVDAVYHANAGGKTEDSLYVWGWDIPYLRSVESPYDREKERNYLNRHSFSFAELRRIFNIADKGEAILKVEGVSPSGRVLEMRVGDKSYTGREIREKLSLPSTKFHITVEDGNYIFTCYGKGHGVGMSQDGANGLAGQGYSYQEILKHYYQGVEIRTIKSY